MKRYLWIDFTISAGEKYFTKVTEHEAASSRVMCERAADTYRWTAPADAEAGVAVDSPLTQGSIWLPSPDDMHACFAWKGTVRSVSLSDKGYSADVHAGFPGLLGGIQGGVHPLPLDYAGQHFARRATLGTFTSVHDAVAHLMKGL